MSIDYAGSSVLNMWWGRYNEMGGPMSRSKTNCVCAWYYSPK